MPEAQIDQPIKGTRFNSFLAMKNRKVGEAKNKAGMSNKDS